MNYTERIKENNNYYATFYENLSRRTDKRNYCELLQLFLSNIKNKDGVILDIGCGLGQHLGYFKEHGFKAIGIEPSKVLRDICIQKGFEVIDGSFETLHTLALPPIAAIWCAASLLHVPMEDIPSSVKTMADMLTVASPLFITVRTGEEAYWDNYDSNNDIKRFIQLFDPATLAVIFEKEHFSEDYRRLEDSYWGRKTTWYSAIYLKQVLS